MQGYGYNIFYLFPSIVWGKDKKSIEECRNESRARYVMASGWSMLRSPIKKASAYLAGGRDGATCNVATQEFTERKLRKLTRASSTLRFYTKT